MQKIMKTCGLVRGGDHKNNNYKNITNKENMRLRLSQGRPVIFSA
jgi:hypothetical protein